MPALAGIHHLTTLTGNMDRHISFCRRIFDAEVTLDFEEEGRRHVFIDIGGRTFLVSDMGPCLSFGFIDPDGLGHEVMWTKPMAA